MKVVDSVLETIPDLFYALDLEGRVTHWNRRVEEVTGMSGQELLGRPALEFFAPGSRDRVLSAIAKAIETGYGEVEAELVLADGSLRPYHYSGAPLRDESGTIIGISGVGRDISERRQNERRTAALLDIARESSATLDESRLLERAMQQVADALPCDAVLVLRRGNDDVFRVVATRGVAEAVTEHLRGQTFPLVGPFGGRVGAGECVLVDDASTVGEVMKGLVGVALLLAPMRIRGRHIGTLVAIRGPGAPRFGQEDGRLCESIAHQLALAVENADLYRLQQENARVAQALARVAQDLMSGFEPTTLLERFCQLTVEVLECDSSHTALLAGDGRLLVPVASAGYPPDLWESIRALTDQAPVEPVQAPFQALTDDIGPSPSQRLLRTLGVESFIVMPLYVQKDRLGYHLACYRGRPQRFSPVQERIAVGLTRLGSQALQHSRMLDVMEQANRVKSEFVATMSHELRTPLNVILGYHALLLEGAWGPMSEEQLEVLGRAELAAQELLELITKTLDLSRLESGRVPVELAEVSLAEVVGEVNAETRPLWDKPGLRTHWDVPPDLPPLHTDPLKLKVVLKNLVANAAKFTDAGEIRVVSRVYDDAFEISVADTGTGIPPEALPLIFDSFRQVDSSPTRKHGGVGLGLYIVRRLLDLIDGSVRVESELGRGSTFHIRLPRQSFSSSSHP